MVRIITVHIYKWQHERKRKILRKLTRQGHVKFEGRTKDEYLYTYETREQFEEFLKRLKSK